MAVLRYKDPADGLWKFLVGVGPTGPAGPPGAGPTGPTGPTGLAGATGPTGGGMSQASADLLYVQKATDTMTGRLTMNPSTVGTFGDPAIKITRGLYPSLQLEKRDGSTGSRRWLLYVSGVAVDSNPSLSVALVDDAGAAVRVFRYYESGTALFPGEVKIDAPLLSGFRLKDSGSTVDRVMILRNNTDLGHTANPGLTVWNNTDTLPSPLTVGDAVYPYQAAHKKYVDGAGALNSVTGSVPTSATTNTHLSTVSGNALKWGDDSVRTTGSGIVVDNTGWYRITIAGGASSSGGGTVRMINAAVYPAMSLGSNTGWLGQFSLPTANTSGKGGILSAAGIWYLAAGDILVVQGRQDSGAALTMTATFTVERVLGT